MLNSLQAYSPHNDKSPLAQWIRRSIGRVGLRIGFQVRGNHLHILYEGNPCPHQTIALQRLVPALKQTDINTVLPPHHPPLYQILFYGRTIGSDRPLWAVRIDLSQIDRHLEQLRPSRVAAPELVLSATRSADGALPNPPSSADRGGALILSSRNQARQGNPDAIAHYLSETISALGIAVKVSVKTIPYQTRTAASQPITSTVVHSTATKRLWVVCEARYSPDPLLIGEPIAQKLRDLELEEFRDALLLIQVTGEPQPDWILRVDLTPITEMLREWARWGDREAIARLITQALSDQSLRLSAITLQESTLHVSCSVDEQKPPLDSTIAPDRQTVCAALIPLLTTLGPQGIHAAAIYGQVAHQDDPVWVEWVNLPAAEHPALAESTAALARQGDWEAIASILNRLLNPDLARQLATGGIRLQLLRKRDLLHVMVDAPTCPEQQTVVTTVVGFLRQLRLPQIGGVRIYGRRSGQKRPLWHFGTDFAARQRLVPEATPEFAATDAYVHELVTHSGEAVLRPELTPDDVKTVWRRLQHQLGQGVQLVLTRSHLFTPCADARGVTESPIAPSVQQEWKVACIWGAIGALLTLQISWFLNQHLLSLSQMTFPSGDPTTAGLIPPASAQSQMPSPSNPPTILSLSSPFPTFNSRQMDEKIALYYQRLQEDGPPDVLIIGSSRALRGVDPTALKRYLAELGYDNVTVFNFGINGATAQVVDLILRRMLTPDQLPRLILWADGARAFNSGTVDVTYNGIAVSEGYRKLAAGAFTPSSQQEETATTNFAAGNGFNLSLTSSYRSIDRWLSDRLAQVATIHHQRDRLKSLLTHNLVAFLPPPSPSESILVTSAPEVPNASPESPPSDQQGMIDYDGFLSLSLQFNPATYYQEYARVAGAYDSDYEDFRIDGNQATALQSLLAFTRSRQIPVIFVNLPLTDIYLDPVRLKYEQEFKQYMLSLALSHQGLVFRDLAELWTTTYDNFSDPSHLNRYGAAIVSKRLAQDPMIPWILTVPGNSILRQGNNPSF